MFVLDNPHVVYVDIDETLVTLHTDVTARGAVHLPIAADGISALVRVNEATVKQIKDTNQRGHAVVVWSAGGPAWARAVVTSLDLAKYVSAVIAKPLRYVDDLPPEEILPPIHRIIPKW